MRKYLSTLPHRSHKHKKRFAFLVSAGFSFSVFAVWSLVMFGSGSGAELAQEAGVEPVRVIVEKEEGSFPSSLAAAWSALVGNIKDTEAQLELVIDPTNTYGR